LKFDQPRAEQNDLLSPKYRKRFRLSQRFELDKQRPLHQSIGRLNDDS
jgi:hypothetical protein